MTYEDHRGTRADDGVSIRAVIENWAVFRDAGMWDRFATVWHADGWMTATWFQGPFAEFIEVSRTGFENGSEISHFLGGFAYDAVGDRAVAQTKMKIEQRATLDGIAVDVTCSGRFFDFLAFREGRWGIVRRQPIYERDRLDAVDGGAAPSLDPVRLSDYPKGYRHLGYLQESIGHTVLRGLPGLRGAAVERLYSEGRDWLGGAPTAGEVRRNG